MRTPEQPAGLMAAVTLLPAQACAVNRLAGVPYPSRSPAARTARAHMSALLCKTAPDGSSA